MTMNGKRWVALAAALLLYAMPSVPARAQSDNAAAARNLVCEMAMLPLGTTMAGLLVGNASFRKAYIANPSNQTLGSFCKDNERVLAGLASLETAFVTKLDADDGTCKLHTAWRNFATEWTDINKIAAGYRDDLCKRVGKLPK
jgi:hypothetical protein